MLKYPYPLTHSEYHEIGGDSDALLSFIPPIAPTKTLAQLWYGCYVHQQSYLMIDKRNKATLQQYLHRNAAELLSPDQDRELDVLLKIVAYNSPQPLHVHPSASIAKKSFDQESADHIPLEKRLFQDRKEKFEVLYALDGGLTVLAGFQPYAQIAQNLLNLNISSLLRDAKEFIDHPCAQELAALFIKLLSYNGKYQATLAKQISDLVTLQAEFDPLYQYITEFSDHYTDLGVMMPLFLTTHHLAAGELLCIDSQSPHQIMQGLALEVSNASHNPLPINTQTIHLASEEQWINFTSQAPQKITIDANNPTIPLEQSSFTLQIVNLDDLFFINGKNRALILLTLKGKAHLNAAKGNRYRNHIPEDNLPLRKGDALFLPAHAGGYELSGRGKFALAWVNPPN